MKPPEFTIRDTPECKRVYRAHDGEEKCIGEIFGSTLVTKRTPEKHLLRRWNSYGINAALIDSGLFSNVVIQQEPKGPNVFITVDDLLSYARKHREGDEVQYFIERTKLQEV